MNENCRQNCRPKLSSGPADVMMFPANLLPVTDIPVQWRSPAKLSPDPIPPGLPSTAHAQDSNEWGCFLIIKKTKGAFLSKWASRIGKGIKNTTSVVDNDAISKGSATAAAIAARNERKIEIKCRINCPKHRFQRILFQRPLLRAYESKCLHPSNQKCLSLTKDNRPHPLQFGTVGSESATI